MEHIEVIDKVTERMRKLVEDLLDLSRFDRGVIPLKNQPVHLQDLIQDVVEVQRVEAQMRGIQLIAEMVANPLHVLGDTERLGQVITNLLMNALNYTPEDGAVTVSLTQADSHAIICVTDTGVGIAPTRIDQIFEPFVRISENRQGSGLGLSIAKEIVARHGGTIDVTSTPGQGSCFTLTFMLAPAAAER
jgi:signal transduction histidine kinase